jgi:hypothetical protein
VRHAGHCIVLAPYVTLAAEAGAIGYQRWLYAVAAYARVGACINSWV